MIKRISLFILATVLGLIVILVYNSLTLSSLQLAPQTVELKEIREGAMSRFQNAIKIPTISHTEATKIDSTAFYDLLAHIQNSYPLVDSLLDKKIFNEFSLLYHWKGMDTNKSPAILLGHMDVVPVESSSQHEWEANPFGGEIIDDYLYGRGTLDDKISVFAQLEAVEQLLMNGHQPEADIYLAFGHDEEVGGLFGASAMANYLKEQGIKAGLVLDEGMLVTKGILPGIDRSAAFIGIAEKGYLSVDLLVNFEGGHSSMPAAESATTILNEALYNINRNPFPPTFSKALQGFIRYVGPELPFFLKMVFANTWLFEKVLFAQYAASNSGNALIRTTQALTIMEAGVKDNVIPTRAKATINFRLLPGTTVEDVITHLAKTVDDERVQLLPQSEWATMASSESSVESDAFLHLQQSISNFYPSAIVSPMLVLGATDSRHYHEVSENTYRFMPVELQSEDLARIHGINERIKTEDYLHAIRFYQYFISQL